MGDTARANPTYTVLPCSLIMNKSQEMTFFWRAPENDFRHETNPRKVMVDLKFDALYTGNLHREPPEVELLEKLTENLYWWVKQCVPTIHRECYPSDFRSRVMESFYR